MKTLFCTLLVVMGYSNSTLAKVDSTQTIDQDVLSALKLVGTMDGPQRLMEAVNKHAKSDSERISLEDAKWVGRQVADGSCPRPPSPSAIRRAAGMAAALCAVYGAGVDSKQPGIQIVPAIGTSK